jgi:hypothetical protein
LSGAETDSWNSGDVSGNRKDTIKCLTLERREEENLGNAAWPQMGATTLAKKDDPSVLKDLTMYTSLNQKHLKEMEVW